MGSVDSELDEPHCRLWQSCSFPWPISESFAFWRQIQFIQDFQHQKGHESWWKGLCRVLTRESTLGIRRRRRKAMTRPTIITKTLHSFGMSHTLSCSPRFCVTILVSLILSYQALHTAPLRLCVFEAFAQQVFWAQDVHEEACRCCAGWV